MVKEIFAKKIGCTQIFDGEGNLKLVTCLKILPLRIFEIKDYGKKKNFKVGFDLVKEERKINKFSKPLLGYFKKFNSPVYKYIKEVMIDEKEDLKEPWQNKEVGLEIFQEGNLVDIRAKTKGRGFQGGVKRWGWKGGPKSHGSMTHRRIGSNGSNTDPGRVLRGHRMPGHMGNEYRTIKKLKILKIDKDKNLIFIEGSVPGARGNLVKVKKI